MKAIVNILFSFFVINHGSAQSYSVTTNESDSFSKAFIQLLRCAADRFENCKGKFLQYTALQENEFELTIPFPESAASIVRFSESDKNVYVEFREFENKESLVKGMYSLIDKIGKALNGGIIEPAIVGIDDKGGMQIAAVSIRDGNGYYQSNIELLTGSSSNTYLLPASRVKGDTSEKYFILLKIYGGIPAYYHNISGDVKSPDKSIEYLLKKLILSAKNDFNSLDEQQPRQLKKKVERYLSNKWSKNL